MKTLSLALATVFVACGGAMTAAAASTYEPYNFKTFAGVTGTAGSIDGPRRFAHFNGPEQVALDSSGNVYLADRDNHIIRKVTPGGVVSTFAGLAGVSGSDDGIGGAARFNRPFGVAVDGAGNVYVAEANNCTIRKITSGGTVSTLAGLAGSVGSSDGTGSAARFNGPGFLALDSGGNLYVADTNNHTIRAITPAGVVSTLAGLAGSSGSADGTGSAARFNFPEGVALDSAGNLYVSDLSNNTIRKITPGAVVTTLAGMAGSSGSADGTGSAARFNFPFGVAVDTSGNVYVADSNNFTVRQITPGAVVNTLAGLAGSGGGSDGVGVSARFAATTGVALDGAGNIYVGDFFNEAIRKITPNQNVSTVAGITGVAGSNDGANSPARFSGLRDVAVDSSGNIYVADNFNDVIRKISPAEVVTTLAGLAGSPGSADGTGSAARFDGLGGVAVDTGGNIYVSEFNNSTIRKITPAGVVTTFAGLAGHAGSVDGTGSAARFNAPAGMALDTAGNLYVADRVNCTIRKITPGAVVTTLAGLAGNVGSTDGTGSAARFNGPWAVTVDSGGNVFVADTDNHTIRQITSGGVVTTVAGLAGNPGSADGTGSSARFHDPLGVVADSMGNVYVSDTYNDTIRKITFGGIVTTLAGLAGNPGSSDGTGSAARFDFPIGMTVDSGGNIYLADENNSTVRKITPAGLVSTPAGSPGNGGSGDGWGPAGQFFQALGTAVDTVGNVYVADTFNHTIRKISANGLISTLAGLAGNSGSVDGTGSAARFNTPTGVAVDGSGNVYVADVGNNTIRKITSGGVVSTFAGLAGFSGSSDGTGNTARFNLPWGVTVDHGGNVYVADRGNNTIRKITPGAIVSTLAGLAGNSGSVDGTGSAARFSAPEGVVADSAGDLYVADALNETIRKVTSAGVVTTLAGLAGAPGSNDGTGSAAQFQGPSAIAVDNAENVYVADQGNNIIRKVTAAGVVTTLAGLAGSGGSTDGTGSAVRFSSPYGIASDIAGNLYVADQGSDTIRLGVPAVQLGQAVSHKMHGTVSGDIPLPQTGPTGIECRTGGATKDFQVIMTFAKPITFSTASVIPDPKASPTATGNVSSASFGGNQATVNLTNVSNAQTLVLTLSGLSDGTNTNKLGLALSVLLGDTTGDGSVNSADISQTKSRSGQTVSSTNFRNDVTVDGSLNSADISLVKSKSGTALP